MRNCNLTDNFGQIFVSVPTSMCIHEAHYIQLKIALNVAVVLCRQVANFATSLGIVRIVSGLTSRSSVHGAEVVSERNLFLHLFWKVCIPL